MLDTFSLFSALFAIIKAFTLTAPSADSLDPTQPITVSWTSTDSDPATFDLVLDQPNGGLVSNVVIATDISTASGTYVVAANSAMTYGDGFVIKAQTTSGNTLATSPSFALSVGSATTINGKISYVPTSTFTDTAQSAIGATITGSAVATSDSAIAASQTQTGGATSQSTSSSRSSGFSTSTTSRSGSSSTGSTSTSPASPSTSENAQPRLGSSSQMVFSAAGILAGLAALLA